MKLKDKIITLTCLVIIWFGAVFFTGHTVAVFPEALQKSLKYYTWPDMANNKFQNVILHHMIEHTGDFLHFNAFIDVPVFLVMMVITVLVLRWMFCSKKEF